MMPSVGRKKKEYGEKGVLSPGDLLHRAHLRKVDVHVALTYCRTSKSLEVAVWGKRDEMSVCRCTRKPLFISPQFVLSSSRKAALAYITDADTKRHCYSGFVTCSLPIYHIHPLKLQPGHL
jgi:hypothetical protein